MRALGPVQPLSDLGLAQNLSGVSGQRNVLEAQVLSSSCFWWKVLGLSVASGAARYLGHRPLWSVLGINPVLLSFSWLRFSFIYR